MEKDIKAHINFIIIYYQNKGLKKIPSFQHETVNIYYEDKGSGIPLVFIHPPAMGRKVFYYQEDLSKNFRVILPDLSGNGDSIGEKNVTIIGYAEEVVALLDHLQIEKAVVVGYSSGCTVAQEFALSFPNRALGIILFGGFSEVMSMTFKYEHILGMYFVKKFPAFLQYIIAASHTEDKKVRQILLDHMKKANHKMWFQFYDRSLHFSCTDRLDQLQVPLLLLYGSRDFVNQHIRTYKRHTKFESVIIDKVFHQLPTKKWEIINQLVIGFVMEHFHSTL
ncbi:alpha/beta fold hydrolase [Bacillus sp. 03113]|uniref:alpha/beta fold hydrolase n=1 Tax=Bacillus sp. 03113 TaxID=2578211 RepID=UPI0015E8DFC6|nr:alpha/beta hydrolase [Bacillus sp. 03113]